MCVPVNNQEFLFHSYYRYLDYRLTYNKNKDSTLISIKHVRINNPTFVVFLTTAVSAISWHHQVIIAEHNKQNVQRLIQISEVLVLAERHNVVRT